MSVINSKNPPSFKARVDLTDVKLQDVLQELSRDMDRFAYSIEGSLTDNPHIHFYGRSITKSLSTIRQRLTKKLHLKGNGSYSLKMNKEEFPIEYLAYMLKENDWITENQFHNIPEEVLKSVVDHKTEYVKIEKAKGKKSVVQKLIDYCQERMESHVLKYDVDIRFQSNASLPLIVRWIVDYHLENDLIVRDHQIMAYSRTIMLRLNPDSVSDYCKHICNSMRNI